MSEGGAHRCGVVAVAGRPNVGKSSLVNLIVGRKVSIVSKVPQTTRNRISGICTRPDAQIILLDTPGIHRPRHRLNERMVESAVASLEHVDLIYVIIEASELGAGDRFVVSLLKKEGPPVFLVVNKIDLVEKPSLLPLLDRASREHPFAEMIPISARTGENVDRLIEATVTRLPEGPALFPEDQICDRPERFLVSEIVREKICGHTREELPHETAIVIESWEEEKGGLVRIAALVLCEKENQKGIIIGREGSLLKKIATEARLEIEALLACRVFLQVWVKVEPGWREDTARLREMGIV